MQHFLCNICLKNEKKVRCNTFPKETHFILYTFTLWTKKNKLQIYLYNEFHRLPTSEIEFRNSEFLNSLKFLDSEFLNSSKFLNSEFLNSSKFLNSWILQSSPRFLNEFLNSHRFPKLDNSSSRNVLKYSYFIFYVATTKNNKFDFGSFFGWLK